MFVDVKLFTYLSRFILLSQPPAILSSFRLPSNNCSFIFISLLRALHSTTGSLPSGPWHSMCVSTRVVYMSACVCECFRVVKLAETARAAHRFSRLHYSSPSEEWLRTMLAKWTRLTLFLPYSQCLYYHAIASLFPLTSQFYPRFNCSYMPSVMSLSRKHHDDHSGVHV